jgi:SAM-dependent methyltransferase
MKKPNWFLSKYNTVKPNEWGVVSKVHLDMGCGANPRNPFGAEKLLGADILDPKQLNFASDFRYLKVESNGVIPLDSESVDSISGYDFLEHLPRGSTLESNLFIKFMNESSRILRKGGVLVLVTPAYPSSAAFQDPTHVNFISDNTINYFIGKNPLASYLGYGFDGSFDLLTQEWVGPLSFVWAKNPLEISENSRKRMVFQFLRGFSSLKSARRVVSSIRKPTHLLWVLRKS